jgi:solute carrier family 35 protein F1/2
LYDDQSSDAASSSNVAFAAATGSELGMSSSGAATSPSSDDDHAPLLQVAWWKYLLLAICDVEGNFCLVKAYEYTSITSVQLLDCFTIPIVMLLSRALMRTKYNAKHLGGAAICLLGLGLLIASDLLSKRNEGATVQEGHVCQ